MRYAEFRYLLITKKNNTVWNTIFNIIYRFHSHLSYDQIFASGSCFQIPFACIWIVCSHTFILFWLRKTSVIVETYQESFHVLIVPFIRRSIHFFGKSFPFLFLFLLFFISIFRWLKVQWKFLFINRVFLMPTLHTLKAFFSPLQSSNFYFFFHFAIEYPRCLILFFSFSFPLALLLHGKLVNTHVTFYFVWINITSIHLSSPQSP